MPRKRKAERKDDIASFSIDKSQIGRKKKDDILVTTGKEGQGKSAYMFQVASQFKPPFGSSFAYGNVADNKPGGVGEFDLHSAYSKMKADRIAQVTEERDHRNYWETLGRLLGMAYNESDEAFFALLEGFYRGRNNEMHGRPALGRRPQ